LFCVCVRMQSNGERTAQMDEEYEIGWLLNSLREPDRDPEVEEIFRLAHAFFILKCAEDGVKVGDAA
jgi:hypothetical protein